MGRRERKEGRRKREEGGDPYVLRGLTFKTVPTHWINGGRGGRLSVYALLEVWKLRDTIREIRCRSGYPLFCAKKPYCNVEPIGGVRWKHIAIPGRACNVQPVP